MNTLRTFTTGSGQEGQFHSLPALAEEGFPNIAKLPVSIRIVLESLLRNKDGLKVTEKDIENLANYNAKDTGEYEIPFTVARIVLQDFTGVPLLVDVAAMRDAAVGRGAEAGKVEPLVPVDLVVDHSVQVDFSGSGASLDRNMAIEFIRNRERYEFLKWGQQAFDTFSVVPPGIGIVHQVNLEYLAKGVLEKDGVYYPDTLVGTDSHTTMINGLGVVGWGVGGIEAEAGILGARGSWCVSSRRAPRRSDRDRSHPASHRNATLAWSGWEVCRISRPGCRGAQSARPCDHRQHGPRIRCDHGLLPGRRRNHKLSPRNRPQ